MQSDETNADEFIDPTAGEGFATPPERVSKSQRKRDAHALRDVGKELTALSPAQLALIPLTDELREAIALAQAIGNKRGALRRQHQFIGKLLRQTDAEPIRRALDELDDRGAAAKRQQHELENLREALLAGDQEALHEFFDRYPQADRQRLRRLIRNARNERQQERPPRYYRELFRYLREVVIGSEPASEA